MRTATPSFIVATVCVAVVAVAVTATTGTRDKVPAVLDDFRSSAAVPFGTMTVSVDITEEDAPPLPGDASVFYSTDGQVTWTEAALSEVPEYVGGTWEASFPVGDEDVHYYFLVHDDTAAAFSAPSNAGNLFPPPSNLMINPGTEVPGDVVDPLNDALDLDAFWAGYSATHLYATLSNATDSWPTRQTIFGPWFVYSMVFDNPDAGADSFAFALVYADVPLIAGDGLYVVDARDTSYTRIADIDYQFSGGDLHMRCQLADLYAHPYFGPDNPSGYYSMGVGTATVWLANLGNAADTTYVHSFYRRTDVAPVGANASPALSGAGHTFTDGVPTNGAVVDFRVTYTDSDGHLPTVRTLMLDGAPSAMGGGPDHDYAMGVEFGVEVDVTLEDHVYYFLFSDGADTVVTAPDTLKLGSGAPESPLARSVVVRSVWPQPSRRETTVEFALPRGAGGRLNVYDLSGRLVRTLWRGDGGERAVVWNGRDESGIPVGTGVYFVELSSPAGADRAKLVVLR
ncbi:MAG: FlgD immunoglobulin-like domain containing protein [Candidatus Eisenbacteria bacterium]